MKTSSITLKVVDLLDRLKVQSYFVEKNDRTYFTPIHVKFDPNKLEIILDKIIKVKGNSYKMNKMEKQVLEELEF